MKITSTAADNIATIASEFDKFEPSLIEDYTKFVTATLTHLLETYPTKGQQQSVRQSWGQDGYSWRSLGFKFLTTKAMIEAKARGVYVSMTGNDAYDAIDEKLLAKEAQRYAKDQIAKFVIKLTKKLGTLTNVRVHFATFNNQFECTIYGTTKSGVEVSVEQKRIINCSKTGKLFHQWPALIYANGQKVSEAGFKKL